VVVGPARFPTTSSTGSCHVSDGNRSLVGGSLGGSDWIRYCVSYSELQTRSKAPTQTFSSYLLHVIAQAPDGPLGLLLDVDAQSLEVPVHAVGRVMPELCYYTFSYNNR